MRALLFLTVLHLVLVPTIALLEWRGMTVSARGARLALYLFEVLAVTGMVGIVLFTVLLRRILHVPPIVQDVLMGAAAVVAGFVVASHTGFDVTGLIATSAVITAVVGFALQDTLGNVIGGLALQTDDSVRPGTWVRIGDVSGRVKEIRWRFTSVMTRNGETVIIPNGVLTKSQVVVLGEGLQPGRWRRWVHFQVDFRWQPSDVIEAVESALCAAPIPHVASDPLPSCICMEIGDSQCRYAVRYWLTDPLLDDPTDSVVRTRIFFALQRARITLSMPAYAVFQTKEGERKAAERTREAFERQTAALRRVDVLRSLADSDIAELAKELRYAPFAIGEVMTRQGAEGHWLYLIIEGEVSLRVRDDKTGHERELTRLGPGTFFGEYSLMTGEPREATAVALTDVECYRLGRDSFKHVIHARPEQAEDFAEVLGQRKAQLEAVRLGLNKARAETARAHRDDLLDKIRGFLGLGDDGDDARRR